MGNRILKLLDRITGRATTKKYIKSLDEKHKEFDKKIEKLNRDCDFWHRQFKQYSFTQCAHCSKKLMLWPYESQAYYKVKDNKAVHSACYDDYLGEHLDD